MPLWESMLFFAKGSKYTERSYIKPRNMIQICPHNIWFNVQHISGPHTILHSDLSHIKYRPPGLYELDNWTNDKGHEKSIFNGIWYICLLLSKDCPIDFQFTSQFTSGFSSRKYHYLVVGLCGIWKNNYKWCLRMFTSSCSSVTKYCWSMVGHEEKQHIWYSATK